MTEEIDKVLKRERIQSLRILKPLLVREATPLEEVISKMAQEGRGSVLVEEKGRLLGILTERDIMTRVVEPGIDLQTPVAKVMTPQPKTLNLEDSVADAIRLMSRGGYRHLPLMDKKGRVQGVLSVRVLVRYLAEHFAYEVYNLPPDPHQTQRAREGA